ncbi:hypothetical protein BH10BDE1_BH10BDE1_28880 [soil metagenome]
MSMDLAAWVRTQPKTSPNTSAKTSLKASSDDEVSLLVVSVASDGEASLIGRLGDLGIGPGEEIFYLGRAPMGEPVYINVRDTVIALRLEEASLIQIEVDVESATAQKAGR